MQRCAMLICTRRRPMLRLKPLSPGFGLEATGIDLSEPLSDEAFAEVEDAFFDGQVLSIPHQRLSPAEFVAFARRFGPPEPHVIHQFHHPDDRNILILSNRSEERRVGKECRCRWSS